jgi:hypothetical protein
MIRSLAIGAGAAIAVAAAAASATAQSSIFLDRSYIVRMSPEKGLLYEGRPAIPLFLYNSTDDLYASLGAQEGSWSTRRTLLLTPEFVIRQLSEKTAASMPVRTPSFMPKLTAQYLAARRIASTAATPTLVDGAALVRAAQPASISAIVVGFEGTFGHYSNGQSGCFRANERVKPGGNGDCELDPAAPSGSDTLNTVDGSFSTWYFRAGTHVRFARYRDSLLYFSATLGGGIEWHPAFLEPIGGMDSALAAVYGRTRPYASFEVARQSRWHCATSFAFAWLPCGVGRVRASVEAEYIAVHPPGIPGVATTSELAWTFDRYVGFGAIVRLHRGQDYYNMALGHVLNVFQYGFTFDLERDDPIRTR